jgi:signal peptidase I
MPSRYPRPRVLLIAGLLAVAAASIGDALLVTPVRVASASMAGTLLAGDHVLANRLVYGPRIPLVGARLPALCAPEPGDVVLFRHPDDPGLTLIKRCRAVEGQEVRLDGALRVVPPGMLYVVGDNMADSWDSRDWGFLPTDRVLGRIDLVLFSWAAPHGIRWDRIGKRIGAFSGATAAR